MNNVFGNYFIGFISALIFVYFGGNTSNGEFSAINIFLDLFFGIIFAYSIGLLLQAISIFLYIRKLNKLK